MNMNLSKFTILFERENNYFLYNTKNLSLTKINNQTFYLLKNAQNSVKEFSNLPVDLFEYLKEKDFLDTDNDQYANDFCKTMEYGKRFKSFSNTSLSLVIAPTLACNFACPYCYEANLPNEVMSENVEEGIVNFINSFGKRCNQLEICWEGGEPLIGFKTIQSLLNRIEEKSILPLTHHSIITNGYLLNAEICSYFASKKLDFAQITIDGNAATHNKSRILKSGEPTFNTILQNIDLLVETIPDCLIVVRTNVHDNNKDEFGLLYNNLSKRWERTNVKIRPAFVQPNNNCKVTCCTPNEKTDFFINLKRKHNIQNINFEPNIKLGHCTATGENCYVIDPKGTLYKCWNDIGLTERNIGNVFEGVKNNSLIAKYIVGSDKYTDKTCLMCKLFPICNGGCNRQRIDNLENGTNYNLCPFDEEGICNYLYEHYKSQSL